MTIATSAKSSDGRKSSAHNNALRGKRSVAIIGGGLGGIAAAIMLQRTGVTDFTIFEQSDGPGGTWRDNRYPGAACDVPSTLYSYSFRPKYDWTRTHPAQPEILAYIEETVDAYRLRPKFRFSTKVEALRWEEERSSWILRTQSGEEFTYDVVVVSVGLLNVPQMPNFPGLGDFKGSVLHTARWQDQNLSGKRVAVVGTGSSGAQIVPAISSVAEHLYVFQREPGWVIPTVISSYNKDQIELNRRSPLRAKYDRVKAFLQREIGAKVVLPGSKVHQARTNSCLDWLNESVENPVVRSALTPNYPFNCKRPVRDPNFLRAFNKNNVELVPYAVDSITPTGIVAKDGVERKVDTIILATGFKASEFLSTLRVTGRNKADLHANWKQVGGPEALLGLMVAGFPNMFILYGPNSNSATTSIIFVLECQARYVANAVRQMIRRSWSSFETKPQTQRWFNNWLQRKINKTVWTSGCHNYYRTESGKLVTNWPNTAILYWAMLRALSPRLPFLFEKKVSKKKTSSPARFGNASQEPLV